MHLQPKEVEGTIVSSKTQKDAINDFLLDISRRRKSTLGYLVTQLRLVTNTSIRETGHLANELIMQMQAQNMIRFDQDRMGFVPGADYTNSI